MYDAAQQFHEATKLHQDAIANARRTAADITEPPTVQVKRYSRFPRRKLPPPLPNACRLFDLLPVRRSRRDFNDQPLSPVLLSTLLYYSAGFTHDTHDEDKGPPGRRMYPSAGGCYPLEIYLLALRGQEEMPQGLYHFNPADHSLEELCRGDFGQEADKIVLSEWALQAPVLLFITAVSHRTMGRYGLRGYRHILNEIGYLGENVYLVSEALGLACCAIGGFDDDRAGRLLGLKGREEAVMAIFAIGHRGDGRWGGCGKTY